MIYIVMRIKVYAGVCSCKWNNVCGRI